MLDYGPQINKYIMKNADPKLQQLLKSYTPQQLNQIVQDSPQLKQHLDQQQQPQQPTAQTQRLLDKLQEEASEIIQAVSKIRRFGPDNSHPDRKTSNKQELIAELEDFLALVAVLEGQQYIDLSQSREAIKTKAEALLR
jgi:NTP pyrophosphatase (non-canonical NTP hydrolase)